MPNYTFVGHLPDLPIHMLDDDESIRYSSDRAAIVDDSVFWREIATDPPAEGAKLQLINRSAGVAQYGTYSRKDTWWTHWCALPVFRTEDKMT